MASDNRVIHYGGCHCGRVRWSCLAPSSVVAWKCNCSDCSMRGNIHFIVSSKDFDLEGDSIQYLTTYTFGTHTAKHTFCMICGITSYYIPRSNPDGFAITVKCVDPGTLTHVEIKHYDGMNWESSYNQTGIAAHSKAKEVVLDPRPYEALQRTDMMESDDKQFVDHSEKDITSEEGPLPSPVDLARIYFESIGGRKRKRVDGLRAQASESYANSSESCSSSRMPFDSSFLDERLKTQIWEGILEDMREAIVTAHQQTWDEVQQMMMQRMREQMQEKMKEMFFEEMDEMDKHMKFKPMVFPEMDNSMEQNQNCGSAEPSCTVPPPPENSPPNNPTKNATSMDN